MKCRASIIRIILFLALSAGITSAEESSVGKRLSLYGGPGYAAFRDEYISLNRYSGSMTTAGAEWGTRYADLNTHFSLEYQHGGSIGNFNSLASVTHVRLFYGHEYFVKKISLLGYGGDLYVGPAALMQMYFRTQQVADRSFPLSNYMSFFLDNSVAVSSSLSVRIDGQWSVNAAGALDLLTVGMKMIDFKDSNAATERDPIIRILLPYNYIHLRGEIGTGYTVMPGVTLSMQYMFQFQRVSAWDMFTAAGDNLLLKVTYEW